MGAVTCCQSQVHKQEFREYCLTASSPEYKNYFTYIKHEDHKPNPQLKTQVKHYKEGNWKKGEKQTGKGVIFAPEHFYYEGKIVDGVAKGEGKIIWPNKNFYKGMIEQNKGDGVGQLHFADRKVVLKGSWVRGYPMLNQKMELNRQGKHGSITFVDNIGKRQEQFFKDTLTVRIDFGNGVSYQGEAKIKNGVYRIQGNGNMRYPDGSYYTGGFEGGKMHGKGRYTWTKTGNWFVGTYKDNVREGHGTYHYSETEFQTGEWKNGVLVKDQHHKNKQILTPVQDLEGVV